MGDTTWTEQDRADADIRHALSAAQKAHGPMLPDLVSCDDPDWRAFQGDDQRFFLTAAGQTVRRYLGWHCAPNIKIVAKNIPCGSRGIITLKSRRVTQVDSLVIQGTDHLPDQWINPCDYIVHEAGWIERRGWSYFSGWYYPSGYYNSDPFFGPVWNTEYATCTFYSGYEVLPQDVKTVVFELAESALTIRSGSNRLLEAPGGYRVAFSGAQGTNLNPEQKNRLANFRLAAVA